MANTGWDKWAVSDRQLWFHLWNRDYFSGFFCPYKILDFTSWNLKRPIYYCDPPLIAEAKDHDSNLLSSKVLGKDSWWKMGIIFLDISFCKIYENMKPGPKWLYLIISVKETPDTSVFDDAADRVEYFLKAFVSIPAIARSILNNLQTLICVG